VQRALQQELNIVIPSLADQPNNQTVPESVKQETTTHLEETEKKHVERGEELQESKQEQQQEQKDKEQQRGDGDNIDDQSLQQHKTSEKKKKENSSSSDRSSIEVVDQSTSEESSALVKPKTKEEIQRELDDVDHNGVVFLGEAEVCLLGLITYTSKRLMTFVSTAVGWLSSCTKSWYAISFNTIHN